MKMLFPSSEFDDAAAAACHGTLSVEEAEAMNLLLRSNIEARDEYLFRLELHARLGSEPDLYSLTEDQGGSQGLAEVFPTHLPQRRMGIRSILAVAACFAIFVIFMRSERSPNPAVESELAKPGEFTSNAVAMLNQVFDAEWLAGSVNPSPGAPLEPGRLRLKSGLAQIVFYSGARIVIQGPADIQLISQSEALCKNGLLIAEIPPQAHGFRVVTPQAQVTDLGTSFGLKVNEGRSEVHVFEGRVLVNEESDGPPLDLLEGDGVVIEEERSPRAIVASQTLFAPLFYLESASELADAECFEVSRMASKELNQDSSLRVHLDFEGMNASAWRLRNAGYPSPGVPDATIVGCEWTSGRWSQKRALEFQGVSDRVRLSVPGEFAFLTIATWVRIQGLDRKINSLFMSDGFESGTVHWSIRNDGVLGFTVIGEHRGDYQILTSPPTIKLDRFGRWIHLAVVLDGVANRVIHYVDGKAVGEKTLRIKGPFRIGAAELGNWNPNGFSGGDPFHIRNFSGAMDEFLIYSRALGPDEIHTLHLTGSPEQNFPTSEELDQK